MISSSLAGDGLIFLVLVALSGYMWWRAQQQKVDHTNVNADWDTNTNSVLPAELRGDEGVLGAEEPIARIESAEKRTA